MTARDEGFLLLTACFGDPERKPLSVPQFRELAKRVQAMDRPKVDRELKQEDLLALGYSRDAADRILKLLSQTEELKWYLQKGKTSGCFPITRLNDAYPHRLRRFLKMDAPGVLWAKGNTKLLCEPAVSLVGSRDLLEENRKFAEEVGKQAALQGYVLISGHARGADRVAQDGCLAHGGKVISVIADRLDMYRERENVLYLSETGFDLPFSSQRALQRNRIIYSLGSKTFVAQSALRKGGTWDGTKNNLHYGWSPVFCFRDGSAACCELEQMGAVLISQRELISFEALQPPIINFIDQ